MKADIREEVGTLLRAALEVDNEDVLRDLLHLAIEKVGGGPAWEDESPGRPRQVAAPMRDYGEPQDVHFPLSITIFSKTKAQDVEALLNKDGSLEYEGERYSRPSTSELLKKLGYEPGNAWPRWRFTAPDGENFPIQALREWGLIQLGRLRRRPRPSR